MSEKIIVRVANKYRNWMIQQATLPLEIGSILDNLQDICRQTKEMARFIKQLKRGMIPRVQSCEYTNRHDLGIVCAEAYNGIKERIIPNLSIDMFNLMQCTVKSITNQIDPQDHKIIPLSLKNAIDEIRVIFNAWPNVEYKNGILRVLIKEVVLEDENQEVELGNFYIRVDPLDPLHSIKIKSVDCVESSNGFFHPHVSGGNLCPGDGDISLMEAVCQGRLEDFFRIIETILRTYNDQSPYESLDQWYDPDREGQCYCEGCDEWRAEEYFSYCESCNTQYCDGCDEHDSGIFCENCNQWHCGACSDECNMCGNLLCDNCLTRCGSCVNSMCKDCLNICIRCDQRQCHECETLCINCDESICNACRVECPVCNDMYCSPCANEDCDKCNKAVCKACQVFCSSCNDLVCASCKGSQCIDCNDHLCKKCSVNHKCLLSETSNAT